MNAPTTHLPFGLESLGDRVTAAWHQLQLEAAESKGNGDHWTGKLSDSALSTATAVSALSMVLRDGTTTHHEDLPALIEKGSQWLARAQNDDGGFGDTDRSLSNIATTLLVIAAWEIAGHRRDMRTLSKKPGRSSTNKVDGTG